MLSFGFREVRSLPLETLLRCPSPILSAFEHLGLEVQAEADDGIAIFSPTQSWAGLSAVTWSPGDGGPINWPKAVGVNPTAIVWVTVWVAVSMTRSRSLPVRAHTRWRRQGSRRRQQEWTPPRSCGSPCGWPGSMHRHRVAPRVHHIHGVAARGDGDAKGSVLHRDRVGHHVGGRIDDRHRVAPRIRHIHGGGCCRSRRRRRDRSPPAIVWRHRVGGRVDDRDRVAAEVRHIHEGAVRGHGDAAGNVPHRDRVASLCWWPCQ